ncbi:MAG TPA: hypothetical protein VNM91_11280 [Dehalococcoidia bacterium]|nr:hypothetical protein [Dehalococcoidia bacterium]
MAVVGFFIVVVSFFTLPIKFLKRAWDELAAIGKRGSVELDDSDDLPFLSWLLILGRSLIALGAVLLYLLVILAASSSEDNAAAAVVLAILFGPLLSLVFIWLYGMLLEFISVQILVARNTRLTAEALRGRPIVPAAPPAQQSVAGEGLGEASRA